MKLSAVIFSNIHDSSLAELTRERTLASVPFGGRYRQIDFVLSSMVNSNISTIGVVTKYNYQSLMDHLGNCSEWDLDRKNGGLFILPPFSTGVNNVYRGKLEALDGARDFLERNHAKYIVLSDANVLCTIDYQKVLASHVSSGADVTVIATREKLAGHTDEHDIILQTKDDFVTDIAINCQYDSGALCGMGMYIIDREFLIDVIKDSLAHGYYNLERDFLQKQFMEGKLKIHVYEFKDVVLRNKNLVAFFQNNLRILDENVRASIFSEKRPVYTKVRDEAPSYYSDDAKVDECLIADGCRIEGTVENSVIFRNVTIEKGCIVKNSIIMQGAHIGEGAQLNHTILDKNVIISKGKMLRGAENFPLVIPKGQSV